MAYIALLQRIEGRALPTVLAVTQDRAVLTRFIAALVRRSERDVQHHRKRDPIAAAIAAIEARRYLDLAAVLGIEVGGGSDD